MFLLKVNSDLIKNKPLDQEFTSIIYNVWNLSTEDDKSKCLGNVIMIWSKISNKAKIDENELKDFLLFLKSDLFIEYLNDYIMEDKNSLVEHIKAKAINAYLYYMIDYTEKQLCNVLSSIQEEGKLIKINSQEVVFIEYNGEKLICKVGKKLINPKDDTKNILLVTAQNGNEFVLDNEKVVLAGKKISNFTKSLFLVFDGKQSFVFDFKGKEKYGGMAYSKSVKICGEHYLLDYCEYNRLFSLINENGKEVFGGKVWTNIISGFVHNGKKMIHGITLDGTKIIKSE